MSSTTIYDGFTAVDFLGDYPFDEPYLFLISEAIYITIAYILDS